MPHQTSLILILSVATVFNLAGLTFVYVSRTDARTHPYVPWYVGLEAAMLLGIGAALGLPGVLLAIVVAFMTLVTYVQLGRFLYCSSCKRNVPRQRRLSQPEFCVRCGASLRQ
jgi:hypothetical protein